METESVNETHFEWDERTIPCTRIKTQVQSNESNGGCTRVWAVHGSINTKPSDWRFSIYGLKQHWLSYIRPS